MLNTYPAEQLDLPGRANVQAGAAAEQLTDQIFYGSSIIGGLQK